MRIENLIAGLQILVEAGSEGHCVEAEHEVIYAGDYTDECALTPEQCEKLQELGWVVDDDVERWSFT